MNLSKLLAATHAASPQPNEPPVIGLVRRLKAAGDTLGAKTVATALNAEREATHEQEREAVRVYQTAKAAVDAAKANHERVAKLADLAEAICAAG